jgi:hypothetical protein
MYATGVVINAKIKPINMKTFRIANIVIPIVLFVIVGLVAG